MPIRILREELSGTSGASVEPFDSYRWSLRELLSRTSSAVERCLCPIVMPFCAHKAVVQKRFGIYPLVEGPGRHVHPKTTTFCLVLVFTPSIQPSRAHQSQNDLEQGSPAAKIAKPHTRNCHSGSSGSQNGTPPSAPKAETKPRLRPSFPEAGQRPAEG